jgi:hypothetical protein
MVINSGMSRIHARVAPQHTCANQGRALPMGHVRNTTAMHKAPRCGARTRSGMPCRSPAITGKKRCRMHGGAKGSGAPAGNRNRLCHGLYGQENIARHRAVMDLIRKSEALLADLT